MAESLILGRYRRIETLGQGGGGTVDLCWDTLIQRRVAIKRMPRVDDGSGRAPGLFEARTGALLNHPSIVSVYNFETTRDEALLIMEAIEGPSLADLIDATPPATFDLDVLTSIATAVANALDYAHENQVLHLDIKPDNILITRNGTTKVSDFGISELAGAAGFSEATAGTIGYMPPEQMEGQRLDQRCDEFAFAMVIYEMLTGRNPYLAKTVNAGLKAIRKNQLVPPSALRDDIGPEVDEILLTALSLDREHRYLTVYDFFDELLPWLGDARTGIAKLRDIVNYDDEVAEEQEPDRSRPRIPLAPRQLHACARVAAAAMSWGVAAAGLAACTPLSALSACGIALTAALAALVKPAFGALVALLVLGASLLAAGGTLIWLGVAAILWAAAWFALLGRELLVRPEAVSDVNCALVALPLGCTWLTPLAPLAAGLFLPPKRAFAACVTTALVALSFGSATGTESLLHFAPFSASGAQQAVPPGQLLMRPDTWIVLFGWILSTISLSLLRLRGTRVSSILGGIVASCLMLAACFVASWASAGQAGPPDTPWLASIGVSAVVTIVCGALFTPLRDKGED